MDDLDRTVVERDGVRLAAEGRYDEALALIDDAASRSPAATDITAYWAACVLVEAGRLDEAVARLAEVVGPDCWWSEHTMRVDADLAPLSGRPDYEAVVARSLSYAQPILDLPPAVLRPPGQPVGALVFLHGATQTGEDVAPALAPLVEDGWVVVAPTGPSPRSTHMAAWDDVQQATWSVASLCAPLPRPLVLGGFSQGGRQAARMWSAGEPVRPDGLLLVAPSFPGDLADELLAAPAGDSPVVVAVGAEDSWHDAAVRWAERQRDRGVDLRLDVVAGLGHELPPDLAHRASSELLAWLV
jgi:predicted esterase